MSRLRGRVVRSVRRVAGRDSAVESGLRTAQHRVAYQASGIFKNLDTCVFRGGSDRIGLYGYGGCDVWAIAETGPALRERTGRTGAVCARGRADFTRSDLILQAKEGVDPDHVTEVMERLNLDPIIFRPSLFEPTFVVPQMAQLGPFAKDVVVLTISTDLVRTLYRHKHHGFLVDPGGFWLATEIQDALDDLDAVKWFSREFVKEGRLSLEQSMANLTRIIGMVREETGAEVLVFNSLTVDPGRRVLDYQVSHSPHRKRRREFAGALVDVSRELNVSIVDVDRVVKGVGVEGLGDFVKFTPRHRKAIAEEVIRILRDREIV